MARADLILDLIKTSATGNKYQFKKIVEAIIAEERAKQHLQMADKLQQELDAMVKATEREVQDRNLTSAAVAPVVNNFLYEVPVKKSFEDLVLPDNVKKITMALVEEQLRADLLRSYSLEPRHTILEDTNQLFHNYNQFYQLILSNKHHYLPISKRMIKYRKSDQ